MINYAAIYWSDYIEEIYMSAQCTICQKEKRPDELISWENVDTGEKHRLCKDCNGEWEIQLEEYEHTDWMRTNIRNR